jgi:hypothetical protein
MAGVASAPGLHIVLPFHCWPHQHKPSALMMQVPVPQQRSSSSMWFPEYPCKSLRAASVAAFAVPILLESLPPQAQRPFLPPAIGSLEKLEKVD